MGPVDAALAVDVAVAGAPWDRLPGWRLAAPPPDDPPDATWFRPGGAVSVRVRVPIGAIVDVEPSTGVVASMALDGPPVAWLGAGGRVHGTGDDAVPWLSASMLASGRGAGFDLGAGLALAPLPPRAGVVVRYVHGFGPPVPGLVLVGIEVEP
jgi:hypothetical protein